MPNTSATGGYLSPGGATTPPLEDQALEDFLHDVIAGVTGIGDTLVRPLWQPEPADIPGRAVDWCAFGLPDRPQRDAYPVIAHDPAAGAGQGADILIRNESLRLRTTFYGPNCQANATLFADGVFVAQNREQLLTVGIKLIGAGEPTKAPELIKGQWYSRCDLDVMLRRAIRREYPVLNLLSAGGQIVSTTLTVPFNSSP